MTTASEKPMLSSSEQVQYMKNKGVLFTITSEDEAKAYLEMNNNYFKLQAYRENYDKSTGRANPGKYINLEFAYLQELAKLDMYLRHIILKMCLDIEHYVKVNLIRDIEKNPNEDGYSIVEDYINNCYNPERLRKKITLHSSSLYCRGLIEAYKWNFPIWAYVEITDMGDLISLYNFYYIKHLNTKPPFSQNLERVRQLRNAAAHNNCIINNIRSGKARIFTEVSEFAGKSGCSKDQKSARLSNARTSQIVNMLYVFDNLVTSDGVKKARYEEFYNLIKGRFYHHCGYFKTNSTIMSFIAFLRKMLDYLYNQ